MGDVAQQSAPEQEPEQTPSMTTRKIKFVNISDIDITSDEKGGTPTNVLLDLLENVLNYTKSLNIIHPQTLIQALFYLLLLKKLRL